MYIYFGPPLYKLNESSILSESMGQTVIILGTYWGTWKNMLGIHWACGWNNIIPKRKEFILFV
jgi:hypothetical protein